MSDLKSVTIPKDVKKLLLEELDFTHKMIKEIIETHDFVESPFVYDYNTILLKLDIISKQNNLKELKDLFWND